MPHLQFEANNGTHDIDHDTQRLCWLCRSLDSINNYKQLMGDECPLNPKCWDTE